MRWSIGRDLKKKNTGYCLTIRSCTLPSSLPPRLKVLKVDASAHYFMTFGSFQLPSLVEFLSSVRSFTFYLSCLSFLRKNEEPVNIIIIIVSGYLQKDRLNCIIHWYWFFLLVYSNATSTRIWEGNKAIK